MSANVFEARMTTTPPLDSKISRTITKLRHIDPVISRLYEDIVTLQHSELPSRATFIAHGIRTFLALMLHKFAPHSDHFRPCSTEVHSSEVESHCARRMYKELLLGSTPDDIEEWVSSWMNLKNTIVMATHLTSWKFDEQGNWHFQEQGNWVVHPTEWVCRLKQLLNPVKRSNDLVAGDADVRQRQLLKDIEALHRKSLAGHFTFVAHGIREFTNGVLQNYGLKRGASRPGGGSNAGGDTKCDKAAKVYRILLPDSTSTNINAWAKRWAPFDKKIHSGAHLNAWHLSNDGGWTEPPSEWLSELTEILEPIVASYLSAMSSIRSITQQTPSIEGARALVWSTTGHHILWSEVFEKLDNPEWAVHLNAVGVFGPCVTGNRDDAEAARITPWRCGGGPYLARIAPQHPEVVHTVADMHISSTDVFVRFSIMQAILALPSGAFSPVVPVVKRWTKNPAFLQLAHRQCAQLIVRLLQDRQHKSASILARRLWSITPIIQHVRSHPDQDRMQTTSSPSPKVLTKEDFRYSTGLVYKDMIRQSPKIALKIFHNTLIDIIKAERKSPNVNGNEDYSFIWCPAIESHQKRPFGEWRANIIGGICESALCLISHSPNKIQCLLAIKRCFQQAVPSLVFDRLYLHLLAENAEMVCDSSELVDYAFAESMFSSLRLHNELRRLVQQALPCMDQTDIKQLLSNWYHAFSSSPFIKEFNETEFGDDILRWFGNMDEYLPRQWQEKLEKYRNRGCQSALDSEFMGAGWIYRGPDQGTSIDADSLAAMPVSDIPQYLHSVSPDESKAWGLTSRPLIKALSNDIASRLPEYLECLVAFLPLDPSYWMSIFRGIDMYLESNVLSPDQWKVILRFGVTLCNEANQMIGDELPAYCSPDAVQQYIAEVLRRSMKMILVDPAILEDVVALIQSLLATAECTNALERPSEAHHFSINTGYGAALYVALEYLEFMDCHFNAYIKGSFTHHQQVTAIWHELTSALSRGGHWSAIARAVCGVSVSNLLALNPDWIRKNVKYIFPQEDAQCEEWCQAWNPYIRFCAPYSDSVMFLLPQYEHARHVKESYSNLEDDESWWTNYIEHICNIVICEIINYDVVRTRLWLPFLAESDGSSLHRTVECIGRRLGTTYFHDSSGGLSAERLTRCMDIWNDIIDHIENSPSNMELRSAVSGFGWWFIANKFEREWGLQHLYHAIETAHGIDKLPEILDLLVVCKCSNPIALLQFMYNVCKHVNLEWEYFDTLDNVIKIFRIIGQDVDGDDEWEKLEYCLNRFGVINPSVFSELHQELNGGDK